MEVSLKETILGANASGSGPHISFGDLVFKMDCYSPNMVVTNGIWLGENPIKYSLPLFLIQLILIALITRAFGALLRPFHQPLIVAEIIVCPLFFYREILLRAKYSSDIALCSNFNGIINLFNIKLL